MNKVISKLFIFLLIFFSLGIHATPDEPTPEKDAVVDWVTTQAPSTLNMDTAKRIVDYVYWHGNALAIDPIFILAVMRVESRFNVRAKSHENAQGLMQILPKYHRKELQGRSSYDVLTNIEVGSNILNECMKKSKSNKLKTLNCYSGGGGRKYYNKVIAFQKELQKHVITSLLTPKPEIVALN